MRPRAEVERLVREHQALVQVVAKRVARRIGARAELGDLLSLGREALFLAAEVHDPAQSRFPIFATKRIEWAMFDGIRRQTNSRSVAARALALLLAQPRQDADTGTETEPALATEDVYAARLSGLLAERAAALAVGLTALGPDAGLSPEPSETPEEHALQAERSRHIRETVAALPERERALIERHYWGGEQFDTIAEELGVSKSWASRMHAAALQKLAQRLRE
jgi:RNA polymerase sigma factor for flagellar operon FliA